MCGLCQWTYCSFSICAYKPWPICAGWVSFKPITEKQELMSLSILEWKNTADRIPLTREPGEVSNGQSYHKIGGPGQISRQIADFYKTIWFLIRSCHKSRHLQLEVHELWSTSELSALPSAYSCAPLQSNGVRVTRGRDTPLVLLTQSPREPAHQILCAPKLKKNYFINWSNNY